MFGEQGNIAVNADLWAGQTRNTNPQTRDTNLHYAKKNFIDSFKPLLIERYVLLIITVNYIYRICVKQNVQVRFAGSFMMTVERVRDSPMYEFS